MKEKPGQKSISSFFNKGSSQLFSTVGSTENKVDKKTLSQSTKKGHSIVEDGTRQNKTEVREQNQITKLNKCQTANDDDDAPTAGLRKGYEIGKDKQTRAAQLTTIDENSDDDEIPPTPSPASCRHSFMKSFSSPEDSDNSTVAAKTFTRLKTTVNGMKMREKRFASRSLNSANSVPGFSRKSSSVLKKDSTKIRSSFEGKRCGKLELNGEGDKEYDCNGTNSAGTRGTSNLHLIDSEMLEVQQCTKPGSTKSNASLTMKAENGTDKCPSLAPRKIVMGKVKAKSLKRSASKGSSPTTKRHQQEQSPFSKGLTKQKTSAKMECHFDEDDLNIADFYGADIPSHSSPFKNSLSTMNSNIVTNNSDITETSIAESDKTQTNRGVDIGSITPSKRLRATPITPVKTPLKEYNRHVITDISLVTPTKNSPNTSRDSLMGVDLDGLMDGLEWSPVPKQSMARMKLFEEYLPHTSPYRRFLVLEVYRREARKDEAVSRYGRVVSEKVLRVFDEGRSVERYCYLRQDWEMTEVEPGDLVHVTGEFDVTSGVCILDNQTDQYIVVHPDTLVSGTTVAGATWCLRRSILNERFRTEDTNESMLIGTLLHDLFDKAMLANEFSKEKLVSLAKQLLQQQSYLNSLYSLDLTEVTALDKINECIPAFRDWAKRYVNTDPDPDLRLMDYKTATNPGSSELPSVSISALRDIEESVWSPRFGLKGKVDATVEVKIDRRPSIRRHRPDKDNTIESCVIPLELKTGKSFSKLGSVDHRAQVILYTLLLSDRHRHAVDAGMLYYMKSGHTLGVPALVHEKRALVMRRNEVARYLSLSRSAGGRQMPGMLKDPHTCGRCSQAPNCTLFHKAVENGDHVTSGLGELFDKLTDHLAPDHARFFANWFKLVCLEGKEVHQSGRSSQHNIWSMEGVEREALGQCFSGLVQRSRDPQLDSANLFAHTFERSPDHPTQVPLVDVPITTGDRIVVSEEKNHIIAIATGYILEVQANKVIASLDRDLTKCYKSKDIAAQTPIYRLDKDDGYNSLTTLWSNVAKLLNCDSTRNAELRRLIIDLKPPVFARSRQALINFGSQSSVGSHYHASQTSQTSSQDSTTSKYQDVAIESLMADLNTDQKRAITKVLSAEDYTLILGMPGTGKTTTIACLVRILVARGCSVLLTSYTHTAVDNILLKLKQAGLDFLRLGQVHKLLPEIQPYSTHAAGADIKTVNELREFYASKSVVASTCLGVNHALFSQRSFDYCIVDEASQITLPVCLGPLRHANVFVLVGDHYQLPPLVQSLEAREGGMDVSLFKRLSEHHPQAVVCLEHQYRMNQEIMALSNTLIYEDRLKCGTPQVANARLDIPHWDQLTSWFTARSKGKANENWLLNALDPSNPVVFLNTDKVPAYETRKGRLVSNEVEAILVQQLTCALGRGGVSASSIGIISPYRHQLKLIKETLGHDAKQSCDNVEINTVDKYQGRDKPCILVSLVRSNDSSSVGDLLKDWRRVNVAVTRAKSKLVLIGSLRTLRASLLMNELFNLMERNEWVCDLPQGAHRMYADLT